MYAKHFFEIVSCLQSNNEIKSRVISLINTRPIIGKSVEEEERKIKFKSILLRLVNNEIELDQSYRIIEKELHPSSSKYYDDKRVFSKNWSERLVKIQLSRFYNQALLEYFQESNIEECYVFHNEFEKQDSDCSIHLADRNNSVKALLGFLIETYEQEVYSKNYKIPNHPHCTHVVHPKLQ